ncbi:short chain type dehydrogenase [Pyrenochaeta sp. DS3sAY3a]|nr:short chain type dehydrogenase [Pyrenochaeta sp. DS3sAY3a]
MTAEQGLQGKLALVSGSAKGIGAAVCVELASRGAQVVVNYPWPQEKAEADHVLERIKQTGGSSAAECIAIEADLSTIEGPQHLINEVIRQTGKKIDILVNNAGISIMVPLTDIVVAQWDAQVNLNVRGMLLLTQATLPHLAQDSRIVNLSSVGARQGYHGASIYNGTKSMIESFTRCWALELAQTHRCTVNAVGPGPTHTQGFTNAGPEFLEKLKPTFDATPMGARMADPSEIAYAVAFFCEKRSGWITGACLPVNGGFFMP